MYNVPKVNSRATAEVSERSTTQEAIVPTTVEIRYNRHW